MRHNHFSMLPERAFQQRVFGGITLEGGHGGGGGGGGGEGEPSTPTATRPTNPQPIAPYQPAGGGFLGQGTAVKPVVESQFSPDYYLKQNPDVAADPYYGKNPFHHYQDFGAVERRNPYEGYRYAPSQQQGYNQAYQGQAAPGMVSDAYQRILGRAPDAAGQSYWGGQMQRGLTGQGLVSGMTTSPEFQRQQEYQRAYTETFRPDYQEFGPSGQYYQPIYQSSYSRYQQPRSFYSPGYGGFDGGMRNPFNYGNQMQEGDDFVSSGPRSQMSPAEAIRGLLGGVGATPIPAMAEGGEVDEGIAGLLRK